MIRFFVFTRHRIIREGLEELLGGREGLACAGTAFDPQRCRREVAEATPDVTLIDYSFRQAVSFARELKDARATRHCVLICVPNRPADVLACARIGVSPVIRRASFDALEEAVRMTARYGFYCPPSAAAFLAHGVEETSSDTGLADLTPREAQVADLLARGNSNKLIARELGISVSTVKIHVSHVFEKYGVHNRTEVAHRLLRGNRALPDRAPVVL